MRRRVYRTVYWGRILIVIALISVAVCGAVLFVLYNRPSKNNLRIDASAYYVVAVSKHDTYERAEADSAALRQNGGAGYIFTDKDGFYLAASAYLKKSDAQIVAARIENADIYTLQVSALKFAFPHESGLAKEYAAFFSYPREIFDSLYRVGTELSGGNITESYAALTLSGMKSRVRNNQTKLQSYAHLPYFAQLDRMYTEICNQLTDAEQYRVSSRLAPCIQFALCGIADVDIKCRSEINFGG